MEIKICTVCGLEKPLEEFRKSGKYYRSECKQCNNKMCKERNLKNKEHIKQKQKEYRESHKEQIAKYKKEHYNKEKMKKYNKKYYEEHKEYYANKHKQYLKNNKEIIKEKQNIWKQKNQEKLKSYQQKDYEKRANDPILRLKRNLRTNVNTAFRKKKFKKSERLKNMLGIGIDEFVDYLLETFRNNYGYEWDRIEPVHIDHKKPLAFATTEEDVCKLFHYTNLQLLKAKDNLRKNKYDNWK